MPTTNPVPSQDPSDLLFNAEKLDEVVSGTANSFTDRLGVQRRTLAGLSAEFPNASANAAAAAASATDAAEAAQIAQDEAVVAISNAAAAQTARTGAEAARDAALIQAGVYPDEPTGRAAVADGVAFKVQGAGDVAAYEFRRVNSSTSALIAVYPSSEFVQNLRNTLTQNGQTIYTGTGPIYPLATDSNGQMVLGYDSTNDSIVGVGLVSSITLTDSIGNYLGGNGQASFSGSGPIYPIVSDRYGNILLGYNATEDKIFGAGLTSAVAQTPTKSALTPLEASVKPVSKSVNHLLFYGQSLSIGAQGLPIISTSQPYSNITFNGGPRAAGGDYSAFKALVEDAVTPAPDGGANRGETPCSGAANWAITLAAQDGVSPSSHAILASAAGCGGYRIDQIKKGTSWYISNFLPHISNAKALNSDYALHAFGWLQGEADAAAGIQTPYSTYRAALEQLQAHIEADAKAISGQTSPVYCLTYQISYAAATWPEQAKAQLDLAQKNTKFVLVTPCYHLPFAGDNIHLTAVGYKWIGAYFGRAYKQLVIDGVRPKWLNPVSATRRGAVIRVRFDVPVLPLVLDTVTLAATTDNGFKVLDGSAAATISSINVDGADVVLTLSEIPTGAVTVRYGLDYLGAGLTFTGGASGNLRDSEPSTITISGVERPLYNVCPHFQLPVVALGE